MFGVLRSCSFLGEEYGVLAAYGLYVVLFSCFPKLQTNLCFQASSKRKALLPPLFSMLSR